MKRDRVSESVAKANLKVKDARSRTIYLCSDHWKTVKKVFKKDTKGERLRWGKKDTKGERLRWGH